MGREGPNPFQDFATCAHEHQAPLRGADQSALLPLQDLALRACLNAHRLAEDTENEKKPKIKCHIIPGR